MQDWRNKGEEMEISGGGGLPDQTMSTCLSWAMGLPGALL